MYVPICAHHQWVNYWVILLLQSLLNLPRDLSQCWCDPPGFPGLTEHPWIFLCIGEAS